jgi:tRNA-dihydrouridine synthase
MIGNDIPSLVRTAGQLQAYPIAAVDSKLGLSSPGGYRKCAGGGLLRDPQRVDAILGALRDAIHIKFTVKTRLGFDSCDVFPELLSIFAKHSLDLLTVHAQNGKRDVRPNGFIMRYRDAVAQMPCPVIANGNVDSAHGAAGILRSTGARGLMIGRGAIRNPWLVHQIRQYQSGESCFFLVESMCFPMCTIFMNP